MCLSRNFQKTTMLDCLKFVLTGLMHLVRNTFAYHLDIAPKKNLEKNVMKIIRRFWLEAISYGYREILRQIIIR